MAIAGSGGTSQDKIYREVESLGFGLRYWENLSTQIGEPGCLLHHRFKKLDFYNALDRINEDPLNEEEAKEVTEKALELLEKCKTSPATTFRSSCTILKQLNQQVEKLDKTTRKKLLDFQFELLNNTFAGKAHADSKKRDLDASSEAKNREYLFRGVKDPAFVVDWLDKMTLEQINELSPKTKSNIRKILTTEKFAELPKEKISALLLPSDKIS